MHGVTEHSLAFYRIILALVAPIVVLAMLWRWITRRESRSEIFERFGLSPQKPTGAPVIWVHGASLGEMTAARPLMEHLVAEIDGLHIIATVNTTTARDMVSGWKNPAITVQMAPLDFANILRRHIRAWKPVAAITLENEFWPNRILTCKKLRVPVMVIGGRMSAKSFARWAQMRKFAAQVMAAISYLAPIDQQNGDRFVKLGLQQNMLGKPVNLKAGVELEQADITSLENLRTHFNRSATFLAASTHDGDEELILAAFSRSLILNPDLKLILAPRHPHRGKDVGQLIEKMGLSYQRRSITPVPTRSSDIFLADTVGEMPLWYSLARATIIGGTFSDHGGHTPIEPIQFDSIVIHGPDVANHADVFTALHENRAAVAVTGEDALQTIFENPDETLAENDICQRATTTVQSFRDSQAEMSDVIAAIKAHTGQ